MPWTASASTSPRAGARAVRRGKALASRHHAQIPRSRRKLIAEPWTCARRVTRLATSGALARGERPVPGTAAKFLESENGQFSGERAEWPPSDIFGSDRGVTEHHLAHRARRLHAARPREHDEAQRGERREQPATATTTTQPELWASRGIGRPRHQRDATDDATFWHLAFSRVCDAATGTRSLARNKGTTRVRRRTRDHVMNVSDPAQEGCCTSRASCLRCVSRIPCCDAALLRGGGRCPLRAEGRPLAGPNEASLPTGTGVTRRTSRGMLIDGSHRQNYARGRVVSGDTLLLR